MTINLTGNPSVEQNLEQISPKQINPQLLKDIADIMNPILSAKIPKKRSGFPNVVYIMFQVCIQLMGLSPAKTAEHVEDECRKKGISFQKFNTLKFTNNKKRRFFPDQPSFSRYFKRLESFGFMEEFWNAVLFAHFLYLRGIGMVRKDIRVIADYNDEECKKKNKNVNDSYIFGTKDGKTVHRTLVFSIISGELHQVIANFKIKKRQDKMPLFEKIVDILNSNGFNIVYFLLDRGFYRKRLLSFLKSKGIGVIMPGRKCMQTAKKISNYLNGLGKRYCRGFIMQTYKKKVGPIPLHFDLLLVAKRKYNLARVKKEYKSKKITFDDAAKRIFPLIVMYGRNGGISKLHGNESYIRALYRRRWAIETAFRDMNRFGLSNKIQNRDIRLGIMGMKALLYNIWQVQRFLIKISDGSGREYELDEFMGKTLNRRYVPYII